MSAYAEFQAVIAQLCHRETVDPHVRAVARVIEMGYCAHCPGPYDLTNVHFTNHVRRLHHTLMESQSRNEN